MNSTDLSYSPPPPSLAEAGTKASRQPRSPDADDKEKHTHIRFLLSNTAAGSIIGKGGSTITEFQTQSGARIQLSKNHEFFPGTFDRIIRISGELNEITKATKLILEKLLNEAEENHDVDNRTKVRFIVPNSSCGAIIGKGGSTIKSLIEESQADIKISPLGKKYAGFNDRLVTVTGSLEEHMRAITLLMSKVAEDAYYKQSMNLPFSYGVGYMNPPAAHTTNYGSNGIVGKHTSTEGTISARSLPVTNDVQGNSTTLGVPDEHIGAVVGRGGRNILEITQDCKHKLSSLIFSHLWMNSEPGKISLKLKSQKKKINLKLTNKLVERNDVDQMNKMKETKSVSRLHFNQGEVLRSNTIGH